MALAGSLVGDGILTQSGTDVQRWRVYGYEKVVVLTKTQYSETREWVALTQAAAEAAVAAASQEGLPAGAVAQWTLAEDQRTIGSYIVQKSIVYKPVYTRELEDYT
jgi:hypothetical protein